jgi:hypothetical protein
MLPWSAAAAPLQGSDTPTRGERAVLSLTAISTGADARALPLPLRRPRIICPSERRRKESRFAATRWDVGVE